jgi:HAD superfamily hydrolase (TIGR01509 family)
MRRRARRPPAAKRAAGATMKAVVFDMDGVLADTEPLHYEAAREVLVACGREYTWSMNREFFGRTTRDLFETLSARLELARPIDEYIAEYDAAVLRRLARPLPASDGLDWLLGELAAHGCPVALASSSQRGWIAATLSSLGLSGRFDPIVSGDEVERSKPDPEIFLLAAERLGLAPTDCVVVEDSPAGLEAARAAEMHVIALTSPYFTREQLGAAHQLIGSLREFPLPTLRPR